MFGNKNISKKRGFTPLENHKTKASSFFSFLQCKSLSAGSCDRRNFLTGFTLIELLVVISIIGLLSSVVFSSLNNARQKSRFAKKQVELQQLLNAVQSYNLDTGSMPENVNGTSWCVVGTIYAGKVCLNELVPKYFSSLPQSPDTGTYYYYNASYYGLVSSRMIPATYGPGYRGWHCSDATGGAADKIYCLEFLK